MGLFTIHGKPQPFPEFRPELRIEPLDLPAPELHWREARNGFSLLEVGDHTMWAAYDPPDWRMHDFCDNHMVGRIKVHGVAGLEMRALNYEQEADWVPCEHVEMVGVDDDRGHWLGNIFCWQDGRVLRTFLDDDFEEDWGLYRLTLRDTGRFERQTDGSLVQRERPSDPADTAGVLGMARVILGDRAFDCVHVIDVAAEPTEESILMESFVRPEDGRLIICRRYNGRRWPYRDCAPWDEHLPEAQRLVVDGVTFIHWYDCLGHLAVGVDPDGYIASSS